MEQRTAFFKKRDPKSKTFKAYNTGYSQAVSRPGTNLALQGLTAVIGREPDRYFFCDVVVGEREIQNLAI